MNRDIVEAILHGMPSNSTLSVHCVGGGRAWGRPVPLDDDGAFLTLVERHIEHRVPLDRIVVVCCP